MFFRKESKQSEIYFDTVDLKLAAEKRYAIISFYRKRSFRGNARNFRIFLDYSEVAKINMEKCCNIICEEGFHSVFVKLDSLTSPVQNIKTEAGKRYCFTVSCTMDEGMVVKSAND